MRIPTSAARAPIARWPTRCAAPAASSCARSTTSTPISTSTPDAEQQALAGAHLVVWMHPVFWYSVPALMHLWFEKVLAYGWAYGEGGTALAGKRCLWVPTTGGDEDAYTTTGMHGHPFASFAPAIEQTARFCGMQWDPPHVLHGASAVDDRALAAHAATLVERLAPWRDLPAPVAVEALP